jgi:hypothetical protein
MPTSPQAAHNDLLRQLAQAAAPAAPVESAALLALLDNAAAPIPALLSALAAIRLRLLEQPGEEPAILWEDLLAAAQDLRGALVDAAAARQGAVQERLFSYLQALAAGGAPTFVPISGILGRADLVVAVAGDFKRGKSSLINALLGMRLLPTRVAPATAVPCVLRYAPALIVQVFFRDERPAAIIPPVDLERYALISLPEEDESLVAFRAEVMRLEIGLPWHLPRDVTVMDLPGLNEEEGRADMAMAALAGADAVLMVLSATQLLAEDETLFLERLWAGGYRTLIIAINYLDQLANGDLALVEERAARLLAPYSETLDRDVFLVSARSALAARLEGLPAPAGSGLPALETRLRAILTAERERTWRLSRLRQVYSFLEDMEEQAGRLLLERREVARSIETQLAETASQLAAARRRQEEGEGTAHDLALQRQRIIEHDQKFDGRLAAVEEELRERCRRAPIPWVWQDAREWLREELIRAVREVSPDVTPRPEGHLRVRTPPGLRLGREALLDFYRAEAAREWERFTGPARRAGRQALEAALEAAEREGRLRREESATASTSLEARSAELSSALAATGPAIRAALEAAISATEALRAALSWPDMPMVEQTTTPSDPEPRRHDSA